MVLNYTTSFAAGLTITEITGSVKGGTYAFWATQSAWNFLMGEPIGDPKTGIEWINPTDTY